MTDKRITFLKTFLKFYGVGQIEIFKIENDKVCGYSIYPEEDINFQKQEFVWEITENEIQLEESLELMKIIQENEFHNNDKIIVTENNLFEKTGWTDFDKFKQIYSRLFQVQIIMIDNEERTDSYFIHS